MCIRASGIEHRQTFVIRFCEEAMIVSRCWFRVRYGDNDIRYWMEGLLIGVVEATSGVQVVVLGP